MVLCNELDTVSEAGSNGERRFVLISEIILDDRERLKQFKEIQHLRNLSHFVLCLRSRYSV